MFAAAVCAVSVPVSAAEAPMTLRLHAERARVSADELRGGLRIGGSLFIDNYTGISEIMMILQSDAPLQITDGAIAEPRYFAAESLGEYYQVRGSDGAPLNSVLWYGPQNPDATFAAGTVTDPSLPFLRFQVSIPEDTQPGAYRLYLAEGYEMGSSGLREPNFFIYNGEEVPETAVAPFTLTVEPELLRGDNNNDGQVDLSDAISALTYINYEALELDLTDALLSELFQTPHVYGAVKQSDVNRSGEVDLNDAIAIMV